MVGRGGGRAVPRYGSPRGAKEQDAAVAALVAAGPGAASIRDRDSRTPLHLALRRSYHQHLGAVVQAAPAAAAIRDDRGRLPLLAACADMGAVLAGELAALVGAFPAAAAERGARSRSALVLALRGLDREARLGAEDLPALIRAFPPAAAETDWLGRTPLHLALMCSARVTTVAALIEAHPAAVTARDVFRMRPLDYSRDAKVAQLLPDGVPAIPWMRQKALDLIWVPTLLALLTMGWYAVSPPTWWLPALLPFLLIFVSFGLLYCGLST